MAWAFVRPVDESVLSGRPLLDLGTGDGQTLAALIEGGPPGPPRVRGPGLVVGMDRSVEVLHGARRAGRPLLAGTADALPFSDASFGTILAADLLHHVSDDQLSQVLREIVRTLRPEGRLVAWWYERSSDPSPDAPRHARAYDEVASAATNAGLAVSRLALSSAVDDSPTVGLVGRPSADP